MPYNHSSQDEDGRAEQRARQNQAASIQNSFASSSHTATALERNHEQLTRELHCAAIDIINSNGANPNGLQIDKPAALEAFRSYADVLVKARGDVSKASIVVQSDDNLVSRKADTLSGTQMRKAHVLQAKQEQLLREFVQTSITLQKLGAGALETIIYSGAKADQIQDVGDNWKSSLEQHARYYGQQIEEAGQRLRALIDAPTLSSECPLRVDKAGTVVVAANFGERGSVSASWNDGTEAKINFEVSAAGTIAWTTSAAGHSMRAEQRNEVGTTGHLAQLEITKARDAMESTHQSQRTEEVQVTLRNQERISRELSRDARIINFRIETYLHGTRVDIEKEDRRRNRQ